MPKHFQYLVDNTKPAAHFRDIPAFYQSSLRKIRAVKEVRDAFNDAAYHAPDLLIGEKDNAVPNKQIYNLLFAHDKNLQNFSHTCERMYRENYLNVDITWPNFWKFSFAAFCPNKVQQTTWMLRNHALYTGDKIKKMYPRSNPRCKSCNSETVGVVMHTFVFVRASLLAPK